MKMYVTKSLSTASKALVRTWTSRAAAEKKILENHRVLELPKETRGWKDERIMIRRIDW